MGQLDMDLTVDSLLAHAKKAQESKKWYLTVQNLNDALDKATEIDEKKKVYLAYADLFLEVNNPELSRYALHMLAKLGYKGGYLSVDFLRFTPDPLVSYPEEVQEDPINAASIMDYNTVYNLISARKYPEAITLFFSLPSDRKSIMSVIEALSLAVAKDSDFDLSKYVISLLPVVGEYAAEDPMFIELLLSGGESTKALAVEGARFFIESVEDVGLLREIGEKYFLASEFDSAKLYFEKVLSLCEIDDIALYYMYAISILLKNGEDAAKYRAKYFTVCRFAMPPTIVIDLCATASAKNNVSEYLTLSESQEDAFFNDIYKHIDEEIDSKQFRRIKQFACASNQYLMGKLFRKLENTADKEMLLKLSNAILESPFVAKEVKATVLESVLRAGCDGTVYYCSQEKSMIFDVSKFRHRFGIWNDIYIDASAMIINIDGYVPYRSELLSSVVKKCKQKIEVTFNEDYEFYLFVAVVSYIHRLTENVSLSDLIGNFSFTPVELEQFLHENRLESPVI